MVADVALDSAAVSILAAYNNNQKKLDRIQSAVASGYDIYDPSDNPIIFTEAQQLRSKASWYEASISRITQQKSKLDSLSSTITSVSDIALKIRDVVNNIPGGSSNDPTSGPSVADQKLAVKSIRAYLATMQNLLSTAGDPNGFNLKWNSVSIPVAPPASGGSATNTAPALTMQFDALGLDLSKMFSQTSKSLPPSAVWGTYLGMWTAKTNWVADMSTATNRAAFAASVSTWVDKTLTGTVATIGVFSNSLDALLKSMQTNEATLNAQADALTKTDLTADTAKSAALQAQQQLLTNLMSMSNQRMSAIVSLFR